MNLFFLNLWRTFKENLVPWVLLGSAYLFGAAQLLEPIMEWAAKQELSASLVGLIVAILVLVAGLFSKVLSFFPPLTLVKAGEKTRYLWLRQNVRSSSNILLIVLVSVFGVLAAQAKMHVLWLLAVQFPIQIHLFQADGWRTFFCLTKGRDAAIGLVHEFSIVHCVMGFLSYCLLLFFWPLQDWLHWLVPTMATLWGATVVLLEGDSGRPFLVNCISLLLGTLSGAFVSIDLGFSVFVAWACLRIPELSRNRFWSVENADQDTIL